MWGLGPRVLVVRDTRPLLYGLLTFFVIVYYNVYMFCKLFFFIGIYCKYINMYMSLRMRMGFRPGPAQTSLYNHERQARSLKM